MDIITPHGLGLMAELIATALLIGSVIGFAIRRSAPWLVGIAAAIVILIAAVTIVVEATT